MELHAISAAIDVAPRTLRYLLEQGIVPGLAKVNKGRGTRRELTTAQARLVAVAALLHEQGFRGAVVPRLLQQARPQLDREAPLLQLWASKKGAHNATVLQISATHLLKAIQ